MCTDLATNHDQFREYGLQACLYGWGWLSGLYEVSSSSSRPVQAFRGITSTERIRPAPVMCNDAIDFRHQVKGLRKSKNDHLVVSKVVLGERAASPVCEPLLTDPVTADMNVPHRHGHAAKGGGHGRGFAFLSFGVEPHGVA